MTRLALPLALFVALSSCQSTKTAVNLEGLAKVKAVAVLPFTTEAGTGADAARQSETFFTSELMQNGFKVVERERLAAILKEQSLAELGLTKEQTLKLGELSQAQALLFGRVLRDQEGKKPVVSTLSNGTVVTNERQFYRFRLSVKLVDCQTADVLLSQENTYDENVFNPGYPFPGELSQWRDWVLSGMARDLKKALKAKAH